MATDNEFNDPVVNRSRGLGWYLRRPFEVALYESDEDVSVTDVALAYLTNFAAMAILMVAFLLIGISAVGVESTTEGMMAIDPFTLDALLSSATLLCVAVFGLLPVVVILKYVRGWAYE